MAKEVKIYRVLGFHINELLDYYELINRYHKIGESSHTMPDIIKKAPVLEEFLGPFLGPGLDEVHYHTKEWNYHFGD